MWSLQSNTTDLLVVTLKCIFDWSLMHLNMMAALHFLCFLYDDSKALDSIPFVQEVKNVHVNVINILIILFKS